MNEHGATGSRFPGRRTGRASSHCSGSAPGRPETPPPQVRRAPEPVAEAHSAPAAPSERPVETTSAQPDEPVRSKPAPIRPPLAGQTIGSRPHFTPVAREPFTPAPPRTAVFPARPEPPAPKPGQILSGPRQPLPGAALPAHPRVVTAPPASAPSSPGVPSVPTPAPPAAAVLVPRRLPPGSRQLFHCAVWSIRRCYFAWNATAADAGCAGAARGSPSSAANPLNCAWSG